MAYPDSTASEIWTVNDVECFLTPPSSGRYGVPHWCGYCRFNDRPVREKNYVGFLNYVPVHGGITYSKKTIKGMTYGFDCGHSDDGDNPNCTDVDWLKAETERMAIAITIAAEFEGGYLDAVDNEGKAEVIDAYHEKCKENDVEFVLTNNFGSMINVIFGKL